MSVWSNRLRAELSQAALRYAEASGAAYYTSLGASPTVLFEPGAGRPAHGNFEDDSYQAILEKPAWRTRLGKPHAQRRALPESKRDNAKELDSCTSSDALLMNLFCNPSFKMGVLQDLGVPLAGGAPEFGVAGAVSLVGGKADRTELDMKIGPAIFEAKLTESDFQTQSLAHVERYARLHDVFDVHRLRGLDDKISGYQLIRNVLAAQEHGYSFWVVCDARRPDLLQIWWRIHGAIRDAELRSRCGFVTWQELAQLTRGMLRKFLSEKYGVLA